jgi:hypothetical protein
VSEDPTITRRLWHRFTLGSGPLKRPSDRIQVLARVLLVLAVLTAVPVALAVATATASHMQALADAEAAGRHEVTATLLEAAVAPPRSDAEHAVLTARVEATWSDATGIIRHGVVRAPLGTKADSTTAIWVDDDSGVVTTAPREDSEVIEQAVLASLFTFSGISVVASFGYLAVRGLLERSRMRRWADGWAEVEPVWSGKVP